MAINYNKIHTNKYTNHIGKDDVSMISFFDPADFLVSEARTESNLTKEINDNNNNNK